METLAISKLKATCLAVPERICRTGEPVLVTKRGEPIARSCPPEPADHLIAATALVHELTLVTLARHLRNATWLPTPS